MNRLIAIAAWTVLAFLHAPLAVLAVFSFNSSRFTLWEGFSLRWYQDLLGDPRMIDAALTSLGIAIGSALISTLIGTLAAYGILKKPAPALSGGLYLTLVTPEIVMGVALLGFFQAVFSMLPLRLGWHTVLLAHISFSIAYVVVVVSARLRSLDPYLEEAALDLGATEWQAFRRVTLPLLMPAVVASALLAFILSFDDYVITSLVSGIGGETLPMVIYGMARRGISPVVNAISTVILVMLSILILASERLREQ